MTKRLIALLFAVAVFLVGSNASAQCRSDETYHLPDGQAADATTYKNDLNRDLSDYGVFFEEAAPWSGCTQAAADGLYKKLYTTYNPSYVGQPAWPHSSDQIQGTFGPYQGWLSGGDVALIQATALRLANVGKLSKPLDDLVQRVNRDYRFQVDKNCGFDGIVFNPTKGLWVPKWSEANSCMEDYTIGAMGNAWVAAYRVKRGMPDDVAAPTQAARDAVAGALSTDTSVCSWSGVTYQASPPSRGPCTGGVADLIGFGYTGLSLHGGDSMPYGLGLFTSIAAAAVGLKVANPSAPLSLNYDQKFVAQHLYNWARVHTNSDLSDFHTNCPRVSRNDATGEMTITNNYHCGDEVIRYFPKMFPVKEFFAAYAPPAQPAPSFDVFDPNLFCDTSVDPLSQQGRGCFFYNPGRRSIYGQMAQTWTTNPPVFSNTGLGDYTVTFRTVNGNYLSARDGGGSDVFAAPTAPLTWEKFSLVLRTAGDTQLSDGDQITLQSTVIDKGQWLVATNGGGPGSVLNANSLYPHGTETFTIRKLNGTGAINSGDSVALQSANGYYVSATNGGGSTVLVDKTAALSWETFTISVTHN